MNRREHLVFSLKLGVAAWALGMLGQLVGAVIFGALR